MLVYRVEHGETGTGPYQANAPSSSVLGRVHGGYFDGDPHPSPHDDYLGKGLRSLGSYLSEWEANYGRTLFGFTSMEMLTTWFDGFGMAFYEDGFVIKVYDVADRFVKSTKLQAIFVEDKIIDTVNVFADPSEHIATTDDIMEEYESETGGW